MISYTFSWLYAAYVCKKLMRACMRLQSVYVHTWWWKWKWISSIFRKANDIYEISNSMRLYTINVRLSQSTIVHVTVNVLSLVRSQSILRCVSASNFLYISQLNDRNVDCYADLTWWWSVAIAAARNMLLYTTQWRHLTWSLHVRLRDCRRMLKLYFCLCCLPLNSPQLRCFARSLALFSLFLSRSLFTISLSLTLSEFEKIFPMKSK